jgi:hypothetical protein
MRLFLLSHWCGGRVFLRKKVERWKRAFLWGVFENNGVWTWCFGGENVVECVVDVVFWMVSFGGRKM